MLTIKTDLGMPPWWSTKGYKMVLCPSGGSMVVIKNKDVATLRIGRISPEQFIIYWSLRFDAFSKVEGQLSINREYLMEAFGLIPGPQTQLEHRPRFSTEHTFESARPGYYIRHGKYLSVPGPWNSSVFDLNIAIEITDDIFNAIQVLTK